MHWLYYVGPCAMVSVFVSFCEGALGAQVQQPNEQTVLNLHTTTATASGIVVSPLDTPRKPCADVCHDQYGYPPNSGQQHGFPPACGSSACNGGNRPCTWKMADTTITPECIDDFDPACWNRGASCCCGTGYAPCNIIDQDADQEPGRFALPCPPTELLWLQCDVIDSDNDGRTQNPPYYTCAEPNAKDLFFGIFRDGTCISQTTAENCNEHLAPAPSVRECTIQSEGDCSLACQQRSPFRLRGGNSGFWRSFWTDPSSCECYIVQGFQNWTKIMLSSYGCTTTTTSTVPAIITTMAPVHPSPSPAHNTTSIPQPPPLSPVLEVAIAGSAGVVVVVVGIIVALVFCRRCRSERTNNREAQNLREPLRGTEDD